MAEETTKAPPIVLDLQPYGERLTFETVEGVEEWLNKEAAAWGTMQTRFPGNTAGHIAVGAIHQRLASVRQAIAEYRGNKNQEQARQQFPVALAAQFPQRKRPELYVPAGSAAFEFFNRLLGEDDARAGFVLALLMRLHWQHRGLRLDQVFVGDPTPFVAAIVDVEEFKRGAAVRGEAEAAALVKLRQEWVDQLRAQKELYGSEIQAARVDIGKRAKAEADHDAEFTRTLRAEKQLFAEAMKHAKDSLNTLETTYNEKLALAASVTYWSRRSLYSFIGSFVILAVGVAAAIWLIDFVSVVLDPYVQTGTAPLWHNLLLPGAILAIGIWGLRVLLRVFYANYHTHLDARERATMIESYLALSKDAGIAKPEDLAALLNSIFRPVNTGLVSSDSGGPEPAWMQLVRMLVSKKP